ncbi:restriction endonuclease subunit S [Streptomyces sp. AcH 505]|uniref:restriction endonuclease subunit S n=1 Tax=Streptomyces sp. AcH 505 TaxID=352211 RepID=UPI00099C778F
MTEVLGTALPGNWTASRLKRVTSLLNRGSAPDYVDDGPVRAISQAANQPGGLDWARTRFHDATGDPRRLKGYLLPEDILINSTGTGTLGRIGYFQGGPDEVPCMADTHVTVARAIPPEVDSRFLYYWLSSIPFQEYIYAALVVGATNQIELNRDRLGDAPVPLPPTEEQRRISGFLDAEVARIDAVMGVRRNQQSSLLHVRRAVALAKVFGQAASSAPTRLKYLMRNKPRYGVLVPEFADAGVPFVRVNDLLDLRGRAATLVRIPEALSQQYARTRVQPNDILLSVVGTLGRAALAPAELEGANVARAVASLRVRHDVDPGLFIRWIETADFMRQALDATGSDTAQPTLGMEDLANFNLRWPTDAHEQRRLAREVEEVAKHHDELAACYEKQTRLLSERRRALITAAVTGQIDVTTARGVRVP